jgi:NADH-ubiquinone oxidoreductase chain 1
MPKLDNITNFIFSGLFFFCCTSFRVYSIIGRGWSSNSNYSLIGAIRGVAQTVSYEASIAIFFIRIIFFSGSFDFIQFIKDQSNILYIILFSPLFLCWYISSLAETNRTPFDFAEGESELVSGFNIEYGRGGFALIFLAEYARIIFIRYLITVMFFGRFLNRIVLFNLLSFLLVFSFI